MNGFNLGTENVFLTTDALEMEQDPRLQLHPRVRYLTVAQNKINSKTH